MPYEDIDVLFDDIVFDEAQIRRDTGLTKRKLNGWDQKNKTAAQKRKEDPNWHAINKKAGAKKSANPVWQGNQKKAGAKRAKDPKWLDSAQKAGAKKAADPNWIEKNTRTHGRPLLTPIGVFQTMTEAATAYAKIKSIVRASADNWIRKQIKEDVPNFKYITWEEYDEIMQK